MINGLQLKQLAPALPQSKASEYAGLLDSICPKYDISTADIFHEFIANLLHECQEFTRFEEGLNYQAIALTKTFYKWGRISLDDCYRYGRTMKHAADQQAIANIIYGGEWGRKNLGNIYPEDGFKFRGSGGIQTTGRGLHTRFTIWYNKKFGTKYTVEQMAELMRTSAAMAIHSACWVFAISKKLIKDAIADNLYDIRKKINGGTLGMDKVKKYYNLAVQVIK